MEVTVKRLVRKVVQGVSMELLSKLTDNLLTAKDLHSPWFRENGFALKKCCEGGSSIEIKWGKDSFGLFITLESPLDDNGEPTKDSLWDTFHAILEVPER